MISAIENNCFRFDVGPDAVILGNPAVTGRYCAHAACWRWSGEECLALDYEGFEGDPSLSDGKLSLRIGNETVRQYPLDDGLEWEIVLHAKPAGHEWSFRLAGHQNLSLDYQPALSAEEIAQGHHQPDWAIGSYAIYHASKSGHVTGRTNYRTGKLFHLRRPWALDQNKQRLWGQWKLAGDLLTMDFDPLWLATAAYPVILGPNLGYDSVGASFYNGNHYLGVSDHNVQAGSDGTGEKIYVYTHTVQAAVDLAVYDGLASGANRLTANYEIGAPTTGQWNFVDISGESLGISTGTSYYPALFFQLSGHGVRYDSSGGSHAINTGTDHGECPDPLPLMSPGTAKLSVYLEYSESGAAGRSVILGGGFLGA